MVNVRPSRGEDRSGSGGEAPEPVWVAEHCHIFQFGLPDWIDFESGILEAPGANDVTQKGNGREPRVNQDRTARTLLGTRPRKEWIGIALLGRFWDAS